MQKNISSCFFLHNLNTAHSLPLTEIIFMCRKPNYSFPVTTCDTPIFLSNQNTDHYFPKITPGDRLPATAQFGSVRHARSILLAFTVFKIYNFFIRCFLLEAEGKWIRNGRQCEVEIVLTLAFIPDPYASPPSSLSPLFSKPKAFLDLADLNYILGIVSPPHFFAIFCFSLSALASP